MFPIGTKIQYQNGLIKKVLFKYYAGKYQNHFESRSRWFIVPNADEIPASAGSIKTVYGSSILEAFKNYLNNFKKRKRA